MNLIDCLDFIPYTEKLTNLKYKGYVVKVKNVFKKRIKQIQIPDSYRGAPVIGIIDKGFKDCVSLESIQFSRYTLEIGKSAFENCEKLRQLTITNYVGLLDIKERAFYNCTGLSKLHILAGNKSILERESLAHCDCLSEIQIENGNLQIGEEAFSSCVHLRRIILNRSAVQIAKRAFLNCINLEVIQRVNGASEVHYKSSFEGCPKILKYFEDVREAEDLEWELRKQKGKKVQQINNLGLYCNDKGYYSIYSPDGQRLADGLEREDAYHLCKITKAYLKKPT